eukprot:COSAG04_NODE_1626_length_6125_cov_2.914039_3_plen_58_part_00
MSTCANDSSTLHFISLLDYRYLDLKASDFASAAAPLPLAERRQSECVFIRLSSRGLR